MACSHPFGLEVMYADDGTLLAGRCPACKRTARPGDTFWTSLKRALGLGPPLPPLTGVWQECKKGGGV